MVLCGGFSAEVRAKKMRQDGCTEFINASLGLLFFEGQSFSVPTVTAFLHRPAL